MKKALKTAVFTCLAGVMLTVPAYAETASVTGSGVNLRSGPGMNYPVKVCLEYNTQVTVTHRSDSGWFAVEYDGLSGFMSSDYLSINGGELSDQFVILGQTSEGGPLTEEAEIPEDSTSRGYINAMYVRLRSGPGLGYAVQGEYNRGKGVTVLGSSGDWTACVIDGRQGYVYSDYVSEGSFSWDQGSEDESMELDFSGDGSNIPSSVTPSPSPEPEEKSEFTVTPTAPSSENAQWHWHRHTPPTPAPTPTEEPAELLDEAAEEESGLPGYISGDYVRFRQGPGTNYPIIESYNRGKPLTAVQVVGDWIKCIIDGETGYVFAQYISSADSGTEAQSGEELQDEPASAGSEKTAGEVYIEPSPGYISGNNVRMRAQPSMQSEILGELFFGNAVTVTGYVGEWTACTYGDTPGYVSSAYVKEGTYTYNTTSSTGSEEGQSIAEYALQFVGYNYTWGGASPDTGFDCSGLVYYVYSQFGYFLNRVASDQAMNGVAVNDLEPGDVLCFYTSGSYIGHAGIYIGDGKFVHAANSATGVIVSDLSGYYSDRGYEARRIVSG